MQLSRLSSLTPKISNTPSTMNSHKLNKGGKFYKPASMPQQRSKPNPVKDKSKHAYSLSGNNRSQTQLHTLANGRFVANASTVLPQPAALKGKRASELTLHDVLVLPNSMESLNVIQQEAEKLVKKINSSKRHLMIAENYLRAIDTHKDKYFSSNIKGRKDFEVQYKAKMEALNQLRQGLLSSRGKLEPLLNNGFGSLVSEHGIEAVIGGAKNNFQKAWSSAKGGLPRRIIDSENIAHGVIDEMKFQYSERFQFVARQNVAAKFPDLSKFSMNDEAFNAMPQPIQGAINKVEIWERITNYSSAEEWFNSTDYWADNIQSVASWASSLAEERKGLVFPDGSMIIGMADEASFKNLNLKTSNNRTDWNYAYGLLGMGVYGVINWLGISAQAGWNSNYIFNYDREAKLLTQQTDNSVASFDDDHLLRFSKR